jgi:hypothetical protein
MIKFSQALIISLILIVLFLGGCLAQNRNKIVEKDLVYQNNDVRVYQFWHKVNGGDINCYVAKSDRDLTDTQRATRRWWHGVLVRGEARRKKFPNT